MQKFMVFLTKPMKCVLLSKWNYRDLLYYALQVWRSLFLLLLITSAHATEVQRSPLLCAPGLVKFVPAVARLFSLALLGSFLTMFAQNKGNLCRSTLPLKEYWSSLLPFFLHLSVSSPQSVFIANRSGGGLWLS